MEPQRVRFHVISKKKGKKNYYILKEKNGEHNVENEEDGML